MRSWGYKKWKEGIYFTRYQTPRGFRDLVPNDARKYAFVEGRLRDIYAKWGYREVRTSMMDYYDVIRGGTGDWFADSLFKFQDSDGKLMSLRGEVTTQIARMLATNLKERRLFYISNCLKYIEDKALIGRESWQAGAELIGGDTVASDAESIALLVGALDALDLKGARVDVGSVQVFRILMSRFGIKDYERITRSVISKSADDLKNATDDKDAIDAFSYVMRKRGGPEVLDGLSEMAGGGMEEQRDYFRTLFRLLEAYGCADRVCVDLGTIREMKYYNGIVFEGYLSGFGMPVGGGGRYDCMMREFGLDGVTATGFALSVDLCVKALEARGFEFGERKVPLKVAYNQGRMEEAIRLAVSMRADGKNCTVDAARCESDMEVYGDSSGLPLERGV